MTILINSYTHSKIAALTLVIGSHPPPTLALFFHLYILHITENTLTYKALHFKGLIEHCSKTEGTLYILISQLQRIATQECLTPVFFSSLRAVWQRRNSIQVNPLFQHHEVLTKQNLSLCALRLCTFLQDSHHYLDRESKL